MILYLPLDICDSKTKTVLKNCYFYLGTLKTDGGDAIKDGCHKQVNVNGVDVEACFCTNEKCNNASTLAYPIFLIFSLFAIISIF